MSVFLDVSQLLSSSFFSLLTVAHKTSGRKKDICLSPYFLPSLAQQDRVCERHDTESIEHARFLQDIETWKRPAFHRRGLSMYLDEVRTGMASFWPWVEPVIPDCRAIKLSQWHSQVFTSESGSARSPRNERIPGGCFLWRVCQNQLLKWDIVCEATTD